MHRVGYSRYPKQSGTKYAPFFQVPARCYVWITHAERRRLKVRGPFFNKFCKGPGIVPGFQEQVLNEETVQATLSGKAIGPCLLLSCIGRTPPTWFNIPVKTEVAA